MRTTSRAALALTGVGALLAGSLLLATSAEAAHLKTTSAVATATVLGDVPGEVLSVARTQRDGFRAWAVTVGRADGSVVVGYVDRRSGIVFDWTVQAGPDQPVVDLDGPDRTLSPAPAPEPITVDSTAPDPTVTPTADVSVPDVDQDAEEAARDDSHSDDSDDSDDSDESSDD